MAQINLDELPVYDVNPKANRKFMSRGQRGGLREALRYELWAWYQALWYWIPGRVGWIIRRFTIGPFLKQAGRNFHLAEFVSIQPPDMFSIGEFGGISRFCIINARGGVTIGAYAGCGPMCQIISYSHRMYASDDDVHPLDRGMEYAPVVLEDDVWVGAGCTIMMGVTIGRGSVVGSGSVVTRDVPPYTIVGGIPARPIMSRQRKGQPGKAWTPQSPRTPGWQPETVAPDAEAQPSRA
jgi:maltose O-acetyltransferase